MVYELYAYDLGGCNCTEVLTFAGGDPARTRHVRVYIWIAKCADRVVIIDPGAPDPDIFNRMTYDYAPGGWHPTPEQTTPAVLKRIGIRPEDVSTVILTHLHYDHVGNAGMFPNARLVVSDHSLIARIPSDMDWRRAKEQLSLFPCPTGQCCARLFEEYLSDLRGEQQPTCDTQCGCRANCALFLESVKDAFPSRIHFSGDEEIVPGISVFWVGGHAPCAQAVSIETAKGTAVISGDIGHLRENFERDVPVGFSVPSEAQEAMSRIKAAADIILPGHDPLIGAEHPDGRIA